MNNTSWYLDNLIVLIKPPSSEELTSIVPTFRQGQFYSTQFKPFKDKAQTALFKDPVRTAL
jgi:hypothetical protein